MIELPAIKRNTWFIFVVLCISLCLYLFAAFQHAIYVNNVKLVGHAFTQNDHLSDAMKLVNAKYKYLQVRNRMPVYPYLISVLYSAGETKEHFFMRAKTFSIWFSLVLLGGYYLLFRRRFDTHSAVNLLFLIAWTLYVYKASYVQVELLLYFLFFCCGLVYLQLLRRPTIPAAIGAGILTGITFLTKSSIMPLFALVLVFLGCLELYDWLSTKKPNRSRLAAMALLILFFLITTSIYLANNKKHYGTYTFNMISSVYLWCDTREQMHAARDRIYPNPGAYEEYYSQMIPHYFATHSSRQILSRAINAFPTEIISMQTYSYGYYYFILFFASLLVLSFVVAKRNGFAKDVFPPLPVAFCLISGFIYFLSIGWMDYLDRIEHCLNPRYILTLYVPFLYCCFSVITAMCQRLPFFTFRGKKYSSLKIFNIFLSILLAAYIVYTVCYRIYTAEAGI